MRNLIAVFLFSCSFSVVGCGESSQAAAKAGPGPAGKAASSPLTVDTPETRTATSVPGESTRALEVVAIEVEAVERDSDQVGRTAQPGYDAISVRVKVTSRRESPRLLVEPRRFQLLADGKEYPARPTSKQDVALRSTYLQAGKSVGGWISFEPPSGAQKLVLKSDLRRPPIEITLPAITD